MRPDPKQMKVQGGARNTTQLSTLLQSQAVQQILRQAVYQQGSPYSEDMLPGFRMLDSRRAAGASGHGLAQGQAQGDPHGHGQQALPALSDTVEQAARGNAASLELALVAPAGHHLQPASQPQTTSAVLPQGQPGVGSELTFKFFASANDWASPGRINHHRGILKTPNCDSFTSMFEVLDSAASKSLRCLPALPSTIPQTHV